MNQIFRPMAYLFAVLFSSLVCAEDRVFHFLPPPLAEWSNGGIEILFSDNSKASMQVDPDHCGWWLYRIPTSTANAKAIIQVQASDTVLQIGLHGPSFDAPQRIPFDSLFSAIPNSGHLYFAPENQNKAWSATYPDVARNCTYPIASILYDSDHSVNPSFYAPYADRNTISCLGVTQGMVLPIMGKKMKPSYNPNSGCFTNDSSFQVLFKETQSANKKYCNDLMLKSTGLGAMEIDSRSAPAGGFFPFSDAASTSVFASKTEAYTAATLGTGLGSHSLNHINATATSSGLFPDGINWGESTPSSPLPPLFQYPVEQGEFADSTHPNIYDVSSWASRKKSMQNLDFCMETHVGFIYRPGQDIYYYGDDDFWLFLDSSLVLDLGGLHFPAPGAVLLDTIPNLIPGTEHVLHMFRCNRLSQMPTFVFRTNILFPKFTDAYIYYERDTKTNVFVIKSFVQEIISGCEAILADQIPNNGQRPFGIRYTLVNANEDTLDADPATPDRQIAIPENKWVWGGIKVHQDSVWIDTTKLTLPTGRYRVRVESIAPKGALSITFRIEDLSSIRDRKTSRPLQGSIPKGNYTVHGKQLHADKEYPGVTIPLR